jgi:hypothetical protein
MSDNLIPISDEQAKLGQEIVKAFHGLGAFLAQALGSTPEDLRISKPLWNTSPRLEF